MLKQWHCLSVHQMPPPFLYNCLGINTDRQVNVRFFFASSIVHFDGYCQQTAMSIQTHNGPLTRTSSSSSSSSHSFSPFFVVSLSLFWLRPVVKTKFAIQSTVKRFTEQRWLTDWLVVPTNFTPADCPFQKEDNFAMLMSDCNRTSGAADASRSCYCQKVLRLRLMLLLLSSSVALKNVTEMKEKKSEKTAIASTFSRRLWMFAKIAEKLITHFAGFTVFFILHGILLWTTVNIWPFVKLHFALALTLIV